MTAALDRIASESAQLGYRSDAIVRDYPFSTLTAPGASKTKRVPLAVFTQTPASYRSAAFGAATAEESGAEHLVRAFRDFGAPLFFVVEGRDVSVWQVYAGGPPRLLERASLDAIDRLFAARKDIWAPDSIHRAKSIGRFNAAYQLDFVDIGLMPAIEGEIYDKLDRLLNETLAATREAGVQDDDKALFQGVFRLIAAKILTDREHHASSNWNASDVRTVLAGIGNFYGLTDSFPVNAISGKLSDAWNILRSGLNVSNISADDLAFVYENTLVTPETRRVYGTHSTPRHVAEYIVGRLDPWRASPDPPKIYEPFAGAGVFLVSALRHLREGLPRDWTDRERHDLLVKKIEGSEVDAFACEVAVLSLILADYPNKNGWKIENVDLFKDGVLASRLATADVVLCNPPFEIFNASERVLYPEVSAISGARAEAVLGLTLQAAPKALGFVLPRAFLMDRAYRAQRREIERLYSEVELVSLPDGVFKVSQVESALLIARGLRQSDAPQTVKSTEVADRDRKSFAFTGIPSRTREEMRNPAEINDGSLWIPALGPLWRRLANMARLGDFVEGHWGLRWHDGRQRDAGFENPGVHRTLGLLRAKDHKQFAHGRASWIDTNPAHLYGGGSLPWSLPKILCNAARLSRSYWRVAAIVDRGGLVASQQFVGLWPKTPAVDVDALAAVLNGPVANAYMVDHSTEKRFRIGALLNVPLPKRLPSELGDLAREYATLLEERTLFVGDERLTSLLDRIDATVLEAYDLSPRMTRALLASFTGSNRPVAHTWNPWAVSLDDPALTLREIRGGFIERARGSWPQQRLAPLPADEAAQAAPFLP
jgi:N-6 DNA Methylase